ncbi:MAG: UDP-N-acetylmuramoyl-L-alanine--D-glutamate ligase [Sporomusaceae bacterium]|jgi:UDP-N-acetylmuramoylalanine--D-glutamate ligase|nr:UDP-N-acetylmuramoyl-L-alanine--D-glutamate ligase [Sporomusaceae bacterium]
MFDAKKILVIGAGISGVAAALVLNGLGAKVTLNDSKSKEHFQSHLTILETAGVNLVFGRQDEDLLRGIDYLVVSPGVPIGIPVIKAAREKGIVVMSEIEVAYRLSQADILAVTGTNGKTTTTALLGEMMKTTGKEVFVGGNIGTALSELTVNSRAGDIVVAEVSSFQLEGVIDFCPRVAVLLNITPDHLDRHQTMANYQAMKERLFAQQTGADFAVLNYDDEKVRAIGAKLNSQVFYFSRRQKLSQGIFVENGKIKISWQGKKIVLCPVTALKIPGNHNVENALAAAGAAFLSGAQGENICQILASFPGVEHRIELAAAIGGVAYYNDSKATNPESAIKALEAFSETIILIAGGRDKNTDLTEFMTLAAQKVTSLILLGEASERFAQAAQKQCVKNIQQVSSLDAALTLAQQTATPGSVVLLSPACASYDMFDNFEARGREFKKLVANLKH